MVATPSAKDFVLFIVEQLVSQPDKVEIEQIEDNLGTLINLKVSKDDMAKIIGKNGQTAKALRILLRVIGSKTNSRINLKVLEPANEE